MVSLASMVCVGVWAPGQMQDGQNPGSSTRPSPFAAFENHIISLDPESKEHAMQLVNSICNPVYAKLELATEHFGDCWNDLSSFLADLNKTHPSLGAKLEGMLTNLDRSCKKTHSLLGEQHSAHNHVIMVNVMLLNDMLKALQSDRASLREQLAAKDAEIAALRAQLRQNEPEGEPADARGE